MEIRVIVAALHLLALGIGFGAVWSRSRALAGDLTEPAVRRVLFYDSIWGIAALLWISTGLARAFGGLEKGSAFYLQNEAFLVKMALLGVILLLEVWPMITLVRWRIGLGAGRAIDTGSARVFSGISLVQLLLVVAMVFAASTMARGGG